MSTIAQGASAWNGVELLPLTLLTACSVKFDTLITLWLPPGTVTYGQPQQDASELSILPLYQTVQRIETG